MLFCGQSYHVVMSGGHSFPRNAEFLSRAAEFAHFCGISMFYGILQNSVLDSDKGTNTAYFDGVRAAVLYVYMISPWNTWLPLGLWREEYWKH